MLSLEHPWALWALPLPYLVWRFLPPHTETAEALRVPFFSRLSELNHLEPGEGAVVRRRGVVRLSALILIWGALVLALTKPTLHGQPITIKKSARDLLLAVDLSGSMDIQDIETASGTKASRLAVVKEVVSDFVRRRQGDRLGLLVFGAAPYMQVPFTLDTGLITRLLGETDAHMAGDSTTLGDSIGLAIRTFERSQAPSRVLILLTDGNDTGSQVPPLTAARIANEKGITIHVIGVGDPRAAGEERLNEAVLSGIASFTHGRYYHANDRQQLEKIYGELDRLERIQFESRTFTPKQPVYFYPLGFAALLAQLFLMTFALFAIPRRRA